MSRTQPDLLRNESDFPVAFGRYTLQGILGEGGMARVFRAELQGAEGFRKPAAVKIVRAAVAADNDNLRRALINEARVGGLLHHPNVVETYDYGEVEGHPYIAMELVRGVVLDDMIARTDQLEPARCLTIAMQICAGLDHAHNLKAVGQETNLVHRDLKPSNIIISRDGLVKVMDFGIAKASALSSTLTQTGTTKGTPAYMSPEQVGGQKLDRRSDLFSLGAIIVELATGKRMFRGDSLISVLSAVIQVEERLADSDLLERLDTYCSGLGAVVQRCLRMAPDARYDDAAALEADLQQLCIGLPMPSPMKLWALELMEQTAATKQAPERASWSSLDDKKPVSLEPTLQTDAPSEPEPAAAMRDASVGTTRAQAADVTAAVGASLQGAVPATRSQSGYPGSVETISDSAQQVALQHKPAGTIWPQQDKTKGLPTGLLIGVIGGLVLALAAVGATVLGDRFLDQSEQTQDSSERAARQTSPAPQADEEALAEGVTGSQDPAATPSPQPTKTKPAAKTKPVAKAKPKAPIAKSPQVNIAASGDLKQRLDRLPVMKPKAKTKAVTSPQDSTAAAESRGRVKTGAVTSSQHDTPAQIVKKEAASKGTIRKSNHRRKASSASSSILDELDQHYVRRPKWVWETNSDDGRRRGYFILHSKGMAELEAVIEVNLPGGIDKKLKMSPSGGAGEAQIWRSKIAFPKQTSGTVKWQVQIRAKRTDGENIKRRYEGKDFRL